MKKLMVTMGLAIAVTALYAQRHGKGDGMKRNADRHAEFLRRELLLTDDQFTKVKSINDDFGKKIMAIRKDTAMTQGTARNEARKLKEARETGMRGVLNDPQWKKWEAMNNRKGQHRNHPYQKSHYYRKGSRG